MAEQTQELEDLQSQQSSYQSEKSRKQSTINSNNSKIDRLKVVKSKLETEKSNANSRYLSIASYVANADTYGIWSDSVFVKTQGEMQGTIVNEYNSYVTRIDEVLDAVCDEITRLESENAALEWDILRIGSLINSIMNEIEKYNN